MLDHPQVVIGLGDSGRPWKGLSTPGLLPVVCCAAPKTPLSAPFPQRLLCSLARGDVAMNRENTDGFSFAVADKPRAGFNWHHASILAQQFNLID
jgi:hypothetical protein